MAGFKAITWNVHYATDVDVLRPILDKELKRGVSILLMQESAGIDISMMLGNAGLNTHIVQPQYRLAWDPKLWQKIQMGQELLSDTYWVAKGGEHVFSRMATGILCDQEGRTLYLGSYHTPAHIQRAGANRNKRRYQAAKESMDTMGKLAKQSWCTATLFGGDDNVDEFRGIGSKTGLWNAFKARSTGLRQVQAPEGTLGQRRIDDFRIIRRGRIRPRTGWVTKGGGDHRIHGREFVWVR